jgi:hypothetical protein
MSTPDPVLDGSSWLFPDGSRLPVVSGGDGPETAPPAAPPAADAAPAPAPAADPAPAVDPDPFDTGADMFERKYVEKLRHESAGYRERLRQQEEIAKAYTDVYGQYSDEERAVWFELAKTFREDPEAAAKRMEEIATAVRGWKQQPPAADPTPPAAPPADPAADRGLTRAELDQILAEREQAAELERLTQGVNDTVRGFGYEPDSVEGIAIMRLALTETNGDLDKAHAAWKAREQAIIDRYIAEKEQQGGVTPPAGGSAPSGEKAGPKNLQESSRAAMERMRALGLLSK